MKNIECSHYKGSGYVYEMKGTQLWLCAPCNKRLLKEMKEQEMLEKELEPLVKRMKKFGSDGKPLAQLKKELAIKYKKNRKRDWEDRDAGNN